MNYACPKCRSGLGVHDLGCQWDGIDMTTIEKAYTDILAVLTRAPQTKHDLKDNVHGEWSEIHNGVFDRFVRESRLEAIGEIEQNGVERSVWKLLSVDEYREQSKNPSHPDLETIYEHGPVDGCKDDAVVAMISYWEMVGLSWDETRESAVEWLTETGAWEYGSWEESSPEEVVEKKRHVYDESYGWKNVASQAAAVIRSGAA